MKLVEAARKGKKKTQKSEKTNGEKLVSNLLKNYKKIKEKSLRLRQINELRSKRYHKDILKEIKRIEKLPSISPEDIKTVPTAWYKSFNKDVLSALRNDFMPMKDHFMELINYLKNIGKTSSISKAAAVQAIQLANLDCLDEALEVLSVEKDAFSDRRALMRMWDAYHRGGFKSLYRATELRIERMKNPEKKVDLVNTIRKVVKDNEFGLTPSQLMAFGRLAEKVGPISFAPPRAAVPGRRGRKPMPLPVPEFQTDSKYDRKIQQEIETVYTQLQAREYGRRHLLPQMIGKWISDIQKDILLHLPPKGERNSKRLEKIYEFLADEKISHKDPLWKALKYLAKLFDKMGVFEIETVD